MPGTPLSPAAFVAKWSKVQLPERAASQEHFLDLCRLLGQPTPAEHDATGAEYAFEKSIHVTAAASKGSKGDHGFADVWWSGKFGWEYKTKDKHKTLDDAYRQLCQYREALGNPPLLIVCDIGRIEIHTNFTGTAKQKIAFTLAQFAEPDTIAVLRRVFTDPYGFKPKLSIERMTEEVAEYIGKIAIGLHDRGHDPHTAAHFLMKCTFCLFAEDVGLLPSELFTRLLNNWHKNPAKLREQMDALFAAMKSGGGFGVEHIEYFNGGLFDDAPALEMTSPEIGAMIIAGGRDWSQVEPAVFGTLFERSLDPSKRAQIGAHYTSRDDIMLVVEPVVLAPLRREWVSIRAQCLELVERRNSAVRRKAQGAQQKGERTAKWYDKEIERQLREFMETISHLRVLDPACGSGNFLYVAIQQLLSLEKEVVTFAAQPDIAISFVPNVRPTQLAGIEINPYAAELAQVVIWIGYLQWMRDNGFLIPRDPILAPLQTIECRDAILKWSDESGDPIPAWRDGAVCDGPADWPEADFIIGNPPFLGSKLFRAQGLPDPYIDAMYKSYEIPNSSDLCCYWFERARMLIHKAATGGRGVGPPSQREGPGEGTPARRSRSGARHDPRSPTPPPPLGEGPEGTATPGTTGRGFVRAGLLATQGIRGGANRTVLERIKQTGDIFMAWSDREWVLDGAAVQVSMVGFDDGAEAHRAVEGVSVAAINADLSSGLAIATASPLAQNDGIAFMGTTKGGPFDIEWELAKRFLASPNASEDSNLAVVHPWINGADVNRRGRGMWAVDFGCELTLEQAAKYELPFEYAKREVQPDRTGNKRESYAKYWWRHVEPRPDLREHITPLCRYIVTCRVAKHRLCVIRHL